MALSISPCYEFEFGTTVLSPNFMKTNVEFRFRFCGTEFNIRVISFPAHKTPFQPEMLKHGSAGSAASVKKSELE